jgi:ABC-type lipoprotein export system ATPase subunit
MSDPVLRLTDLAKSYQSKGASDAVQALDGITLDINAGEFVALLGPSGCGKSTLLLTAGGLLKPDAGSVTLKSQDMYALNNSQRARFRAKNLGFVFQQFHLIPYLTVLDNVEIADITDSSSSHTQSAADALSNFGLGDRLQHLPSELSVGEQQRVALARAVYSGASVLFADEPTGNLDGQNADSVLHYMRTFADNGGAVIMVTHDDRAVASASRQLNMEKGKLLQ